MFERRKDCADRINDHLATKRPLAADPLNAIAPCVVCVRKSRKSSGSPRNGTLSIKRSWFRQGLKEAGFVEGQNVAIEYGCQGGSAPSA